MVQRFMKAVFNERPTFPKTTVTWDVDQVLNYLRDMGMPDTLTLPQLTKKLCMMLLILSGQRGQTVHVLDIVNMTLTDDVVSFRIAELLKTSRPNRHQQEIKFQAYPHDPCLCIVSLTAEYMRRTEALRGSTQQLFITTRPPHNAASRDTVRRWTKAIMVAAGVDLTIFHPHSTRSAATSRAATKLPLATILATAGWHRPSTFQRFYKKTVDNTFDFAHAMLT